MQAHHLAQGTGEQPVRVGVAQIGLEGEGQARQIFQALYVVRLQAALPHPVAKQLDVVVSPADRGLQAVKLQVPHLRPGQVVRSAAGVESHGDFLVGSKHERLSSGARRRECMDQSIVCGRLWQAEDGLRTVREQSRGAG